MQVLKMFLGKYRNMGSVDRLIRIALGLTCIAIGILASDVIGVPLLNLLLVIFGVVNLISSAASVCPAYAVCDISTVESERLISETDDGDMSVIRKIQNKIVMFAAAIVVIVLGIFSIVLFHGAHDLAMSEDSLRGEAAALLAIELHKQNSRDPGRLSTASTLESYAEMAKEVDLVIFHDRNSQKIDSSFQLLGKDPALVEEFLASIDGSELSTGEIERDMLMHNGKGLLRSSLPVSDNTWVSVMITSDSHSGSISKLLVPKLLIVGLSVLWLAIWGVTYGLKKYSKQTIKAARELQYRSTHDPLTGLQNRIGLDEVLHKRIAETDDMKNGFAVILVDLVRFRYVNDTLGYELGDQLLVEVADRLKSISSEFYSVIRMSSDVFCVICPCEHDRANACRVANKIQDCIEAQKQLGDIPLNMQTRIGMSFFPFDSKTGPELVRLADIALSQAKKNNTRISYYQAANDSHSVRQLTLLAGLRSAIEEDELTLVYQPKVDIQAGTFVGVEALARWTHPTYGFVSPMEFVSWAEKSGLIDKLTMWVLRSAETQSRLWKEAGFHIPIAINLSPVNLSSEALTHLIEELVKEGDFDRGLLELELTENAVMEDPVKALQTMEKFQQLDIPIAIDDFGTGLSSFTYLRRFPVSNLKIDRSFVMDTENEDRDAVLLRSMIELGHNLGCVVTAEGVEDAVVLDMLKQYGCNYVQGYGVCKPAPAQEIIEWYLSSDYQGQRLAA